MVIKLVTIFYRDDKKETFECIEYPYPNGPYFHLNLGDKKIDIPNEAISKIETKEIWKRRSTPTKKHSSN